MRRNDSEGHERASERKRDSVAPRILPGEMLVAVCLCARAAGPLLGISQYARIPSKIGDGSTKGGVTSIRPYARRIAVADCRVLCGALRWRPSRSMAASATAASPFHQDLRPAGRARWHSASYEDHEGTIWAGGLKASPPEKAAASNGGAQFGIWKYACRTRGCN